jgi:hypothetical protein
MNYLMSCTGSDGAEFLHADVDLLLGLDGRNKLGIGACRILAVTTNIRAQDFADNKPASFENDQKREYHPVFPTALPADANIDSYLAPQLRVVTCKTNRIIGRKDALEHLQDRVEWAGESVKELMKSHLIDFDSLNKAS